MITAKPTLQLPRTLLRNSKWDALFIGLSLLHGGLVLAAPVAPVIAIGLWWNSNTISHYFIHKPFFRPRPFNCLFSLYLTVLLGVPQSLWRDRHLAHHAGMAWKLRLTTQMKAELAFLLILWAALLAMAPLFFLYVYVPGYLTGLGLCWLHGYCEHAPRGCMSHYGTLYNVLFFNDGYHVEHHAHPGEHWKRLPGRVVDGATGSRYPAILRWLELFSLESLERCVLRSRTLQRFVLDCHEQAFRRLLHGLPVIRRVGIVGGGLFPRTCLILRKLLPDASLVVIDQNADNLQRAREWIGRDVLFVNGTYDPARADSLNLDDLDNGTYDPARTDSLNVDDLDLVVIPLSFVGDRQVTYRVPPAPAVLVHDWIWRPRGISAVVSPFLLKRLNLVTRATRENDQEKLPVWRQDSGTLSKPGQARPRLGVPPARA